MTLTLAALVLTNLLYLVGAVAVASVVSGLYVLRHRKPKSVESGIESFSRGLRALAPEHPTGSDRSETVSPSNGPRPPTLRPRTVARGGGPRHFRGGSVATATGRRPGAGARPGVAVPRDGDGAAETGASAPGPAAPGPPAEESPAPTAGEGSGEPAVDDARPADRAGSPTTEAEGPTTAPPSPPAAPGPESSLPADDGGAAQGGRGG